MSDPYSLVMRRAVTINSEISMSDEYRKKRFKISSNNIKTETIRAQQFILIKKNFRTYQLFLK